MKAVASGLCACAIVFLLAGAAVTPAVESPAASPEAPSPVATEVFTGSGEAQRAVERPATPTVAYWRVEIYVEMPAATPGARLEMLLPLSDAHQRILVRRVVADDFSFQESSSSLNLRGIWVRTASPEPAEIQYEITAEISDSEATIPRDARARKRRLSAESRDDLEASALVQSGDPEIRRRARELTADTPTTDAAAWALFQYAASLAHGGGAEVQEDARSVLQAQRGNATGKARLLTAMLRSRGIPARVVGGLKLEDATKKRATVSWVEADLGNGWVPVDPGGNHFGWLPHDYLALYRGDLPLIVHSGGLDVEYGFVVRKATREVALGLERAQPGTRRVQVETRIGAQRVRAVTSYQDKPVASALLLVDQSVPENVSERIVREARADEVSIVMLQASFESRYFREQHLQRLVANNVSLVSGAHMVLVSTMDDAGLYALFALGERGITMGDARIVIAGSFPAPVGTVLGAVLLRLLDAGEIVLVHRPAALLGLWETARANLLRGVPMEESSQKWDLQMRTVTPATLRQMSRWRRLVVGAWTRAVRAQVPLQALNLILILPIIASIIVIARVVVGIDTFGTFSPVIVSLAFLTTGLQWGAIIFVVIVTSGALVRMLLQRLRLQLVSRLSILIATVAGVMAGLTVLGASFGIGALINVSIFPMVIMSSVIENFASSQFEFGTREAVRLTFNTLIMACICYLSIETLGLQSIVLAFPEVILVAVGLNVALGKWRGLRLTEYLRFADLARERPRA